MEKLYFTTPSNSVAIGAPMSPSLVQDIPSVEEQKAHYGLLSQHFSAEWLGKPAQWRAKVMLGADGHVSELDIYHSVLLDRSKTFVEAERRTLVLDQTAGGVLVSDLVGRKDEVAPWAAAFTNAGFSNSTTILRMQRAQAGQAPAADTDSGVEVARAGDAEQIHAALLANFDVYIDQLPPLEETREAAASAVCRARAEALPCPSNVLSRATSLLDAV